MNETNLNQLDRRKQRTRRALREALVELILEKGYDAITVQDITDRADLNRGTLYLHYRDKNDLLMRSSQDIYNELLAEFEPLTKQRVLAMEIPKRNLAIMFDHVAANANFYRVILGANGVPAFRAMLREIVIQVGLKRLLALERLQATTPAIPSELLIGFAEGAIMGVIEWWLENNLSTPVEVVAQHTLDLVVGAIYPMMGLKIPPNRQLS